MVVQYCKDWPWTWPTLGRGLMPHAINDCLMVTREAAEAAWEPIRRAAKEKNLYYWNYPAKIEELYLNVPPFFGPIEGLGTNCLHNLLKAEEEGWADE